MTTPQPIDGRRLALATLVAAVVAAIVLLIAVLPAEYGLDPTDLGRRMGFLRLSGGDTGNEESVSADNDNADEPPAVYAVDVRWRLRRVPLAEQSGSSTRTDGEQRVELPLKIPNLTAVSARLTWDRRNDETFDLDIVAPDGRHGEPAVAPDAQGPGTVSEVLRWREVPAPQLGRDAITIPIVEDRSAAGTWTFVVRRTTTPGTTNEGDGNAARWALSVSAETFEIEISSSGKVPAGGRAAGED